MDQSSLLLSSLDEFLDFCRGCLVLTRQLLLVILKLAHASLDVQDRLVVRCDTVLAGPVLNNWLLFLLWK